MVTMMQNYGPLKEGKTFKVIDEGFDWVLVSFKGKPLFVSREFVSFNRRSRR